MSTTSAEPVNPETPCDCFWCVRGDVFKDSAAGPADTKSEPTLRSVQPKELGTGPAPEPAPAGRKDDTGKILTGLLPMGALEAALVALVIHPGVTDAPWVETFEHLVAWHRGSKTFGGAERMGIIAASLLVLLTRELRGDVRITRLFPDCGPAMLAVAKVLTFGASKYGPNNWQKLEKFAERYYAGVLRHLFAHGGGETTDPESGLPHLAHAACGALFLLSGEVGHDPA